MNEDEWVLFSYFVCFFYFVLLWSNVTQTIGVGERTKNKSLFQFAAEEIFNMRKVTDGWSCELNNRFPIIDATKSDKTSLLLVLLKSLIFSSKNIEW